MQIQFLNGENAGTLREIEPAGVGIGRETDNGIQLLGGRVSRYHARLEKQQDGWHLLDLGSTNGTKVNGKSISGSVHLQHGDVVGVAVAVHVIFCQEVCIFFCFKAKEVAEALRQRNCNNTVVQELINS